jgi:hypothetical protein
MALYIDQFSAESLLVIKKPPSSAPTIVPFQTGSENNFLEDRFVCFGYRYQYADGEYSATSQFSPPAFTSSSFRFGLGSFLNEGMLNSTNAVRVEYNTGGPLVKSIEILFKELNDPTIKIIENLNKVDLGLGNNQSAVYTFENQKIFTVLPEYEILRLYDNVPLLAKAQTLMGNRMVYGNYVEGYNLIDRLDDAVQFNFSTELKIDEIGLTDLTTLRVDGGYDLGGYVPIPLAKVNITLDPADLIKGASITISVQVQHYSFAGQAPFPTETTVGTLISFTYVLPQTFTNVYQLAQSSDFVSKIGTASNIKTVANSCTGSTFTDIFNCAIPNQLDAYFKKASGISAVGEPIEIFSSPSSNDIGLQFPAMQFVDNINTPTQTFYEYYNLSFADASYTKASNNYSLHSNRGYEIGIVYMDEFNRASTALVSPFNTIHVPCENSAFKNSIRVTIPGGNVTPAQIAPYWATRYKFVIKADKDTYNTIYTNIYFEDPDNNSVYFLLEGENSKKIEEGDRLIVKSDTHGPRKNCTFTTVLEKETKSANFLSIPDPLQPGVADAFISIPGGVYMKLNPNNFVVNNDETAGGNIITGNLITEIARSRGVYGVAAAPVTVENPNGSGATANMDYTLPAGSRVIIEYTTRRDGRSNSLEQRSYELTLELTASQDYNNFKDFFDGDNVSALLDTGTSCNGWPRNSCNQTSYLTSYDNTYESPATTGPPSGNIRSGNSQINAAFGTIFFRFYEDTSTGKKYLMATGAEAAGSGSRAKSFTTLRIEVVRAETSVIFETLPADALPDVWYENDLSFSIDKQGQHSGNVQDQIIDFQNTGTITPQAAIIDTGFSNCIAFGNGVESYKIRDSINSKTLNFGNRVTSTSAQIYKEAHRFADLTYSGVFNDESNVNKLNEYNLGLLNFKPLEDLYGPIERLHARRTDILTLQEDKISYVLQGKDILTDAGGGGALTSVPTVLGQQIARDEEFGISNNPESFAVYGAEKFFTDAKRGAVLRLKGGDSGPEMLSVISEVGMRGWFRDFFIDTIGNQKLGAYDPYMNEYVLASNGENIAGFTNCLPCGLTENVLVNPGQETIYCVNVTQEIGTVAINYVIPNAEEDALITEINTPSAGTGLQQIVTEQGLPIDTEETNTGVGYTIEAIYNNVSYTTGLVFISGTLFVNKNIVDATQITLRVTTSSLTPDTIQITTECPEENTLTIYNIALTSGNEAGQFIHNQYSWTDNTFTSPLHSTQITFSADTSSNPIVSQFDTVSGPIGAGIIPNEAALVNIISNKIGSDNFEFDSTTNQFRFLRTDATYQNNSNDILTLFGLSSQATPIVTTGDKHSAQFAMPNNTGDKLYLIWDYRKPTQAILNTGTSDFDACCNSLPVGPIVICGQGTNYFGGEAYPDTQIIELGNSTGVVTLEYDAYSIPDRFTIEFDGVVVIDTGYRGFAGDQGQLNTALAALGEPPATIQGTGRGTATFNKTTATAQAVLKVYAPMDGTGWEATVSCPV